MQRQRGAPVGVVPHALGHAAGRGHADASAGQRVQQVAQERLRVVQEFLKLLLHLVAPHRVHAHTDYACITVWSWDAAEDDTFQMYQAALARSICHLLTDSSGHVWSTSHTGPSKSHFQ